MQTLSLDGIQADYDTRRKNAQRLSHNHSGECFACGRGLTAAAIEKGWMVWLATTGGLIPMDATNVPENLDQGWFPVGSECAKRVPLTHRARPQMEN